MKLTLSQLRAIEVALCEEWQKKNGGRQAVHRKWKHEGKYSDVDEALNLWFSNVTSRKVQVDSPMLNAKVESFAKKMDHDNFTAMDG